MTNTITFRWDTGKIEIAACTVLDMTATQLTRLVKTATENAEEVKDQIAAYIQSEIDKLNPKSEYDKKMIGQYNKLIAAAVGERRQTAQEKAIARILKNCTSAMADKYMGVIHDAGMYCVLDGFRLVRYAAPLENFPKAAQTFDTNRAIGDKIRYNVKLLLPSVKELKADMKIAKLSEADVNRIHVIVKGKRIDFGYDFGMSLPMVNAKWLIDMIEALPDAAAYAVEGRNTNPIYFTDGTNDGIILPIRKESESNLAPAIDNAPVEQAAPVVEETPIETPVESAPAPVEAVESELVDVEAVETPAEDPAPDMKLNQIEAALENRQVYGYKRDGNTVTAHRWKVYHVTGNLYLQEPHVDSCGQKYAHVALFFPGVKIGLDMGILWWPEKYTVEYVTSRNPISTFDALNELLTRNMENSEHIRDSYISFVRQYDTAFADRLAAYKADYIQRMEQKQQAAHEERTRRAEQKRLERERAIADELAKAEQTIINGGYVENKVLDGKPLFLRLFDKHGIALAIRSRGWAINKLRGFEQHNDGMITIRYSQTRKNEKISDGCFATYCKLRELLKKREAEKQAEQEAAAIDIIDTVDTVDSAADIRVAAVAAVVNSDNAHIPEYIYKYLDLYSRGMITEEEAKDTFLRYTVPLALPAHEDAPQATESAATASVVVIVPTVLRRSMWHYRYIRRARNKSITLADIAMAHINTAFCTISEIQNSS